MTIRFTIILLIGFISLSFAQDWQWERNDELLNPSGIKTKGMNTPFTGDFDNDGDIDMIVGCKGGVLQYYENIGTPDSAIWRMDEDYFATLDLDTTLAPQPSLTDLNGDGIAELYLTFQDSDGYPAGLLTKFINTGSSSNPVWEESDFDIGHDLSILFSHQFADYDFDGDLDLLMSSDGWGHYFENIGNANNPQFQVNDTLFSTLDYWPGYTTTFRLANIAGDEKREVIEFTDAIDTYDHSELFYFSNNGSVDNPIWVEGTLFSFSKGISNGYFADIDNDADLDLIVGTHWLQLFYNENIGSPVTPVFNDICYNRSLGPLYFYNADNICLVDYDNDRDFDFTYLFWYINWGDYEPYLGWESLTNVGDSFSPDFSGRGFVPWPWTHWRDFYLSAGDLNGDGYPELASNSNYFINQGGTGYAWGYSGGFEIGDPNYNKYAELADFDNDGLTDLLIRHSDSLWWRIYKNVGTPEEPAWQWMPDWLSEVDQNMLKFRAANINQDEKIDLIGISPDLHMKGFISNGSNNDVSFAYVPEIFESWEDYNVYYYDCVDLDGDGDDDIVVDSTGVINFIENKTPVNITETSVNLARGFRLSQNYPNPFNSSTNISFTLDKPGHAQITIFDILGREVASLADETFAAGKHTITWNADNNLSSGIYFYRLKANDEILTRQMVYIK